MTDQARSRRPSSGRPLRAGSSPGAGTLGLADETEPSLGDVRFDDWFETPVFESDPDERLEELATARRGPMRLAASTLLRLNARASQVRRRSGEAEPAGAGAPPESAPERSAEPVEAPAARRPSAGAANRRLNPKVGTAAGPRTRPTGTVKSGAARAAGRPAPTGTVKTPAGRPAPAAEVLPLPPASSIPAQAGLRQRFNDALDRWAEREAAAQTRLERIILPKRWQA